MLKVIWMYQNELYDELLRENIIADKKMKTDSSIK